MNSAELNIYAPSGDLRLTAVPEKGSVRDYMLMQKDEVRLRFVSSEAVRLRTGDWILVEGAGVYECTDERQRPEWDNATGGYRYDVTFQARYRKFANRLHRFFTDISSPETKWTLTAGILAHGQRIMDTMNAIAASTSSFRPYGSEKWKVETDGTVDAEKCITITYDGVSVLDAIDMVAREFECEWWFEGDTLWFGVCRHSTPVAMEAGRELVNLSRSDSSESNATRIYFQGGTRNIPSTYRHTLLFHVDGLEAKINGSYTFRDAVRDIPDDAVKEEARVYGFIDEDMVSLPLRSELRPVLATYEATQTGESIRLKPEDVLNKQWTYEISLILEYDRSLGYVAPGKYRLDLSNIGFEISNPVFGGGGPQDLSATVPFRYTLEVGYYSSVDCKVGEAVKLSDRYHGGWHQCGAAQTVTLGGEVHMVDIEEDSRVMAVLFRIYPVADTRGLTLPLTCVVKQLLTKDADADAVSCLIPRSKTRFSANLSIQLREKNGTPHGDPIDVVFNPSMSELKAGRNFRIPPMGLPVSAGEFLLGTEDRWFTVESGIDLPFVPAAYWTSDTVMRNGSEATVNGVAERRLLLPLKDEDGLPLNGYLDTYQMESEDEVIEEVMTLDECFPGTETTITELSQTETSYTDTYELSDGSEDKMQWKAWRFKCGMFTDERPFNPKYRLDSEKLQVTFRDYVDEDGVTHSGGALNGMTFELIYSRETKTFEIVRDTTTLLPNEVVRPKIGDAMVLTGFDVRMLSDEDVDIIASAEKRLLKEARKIVAEINTDASTYEGNVMCDIAFEQYPDFSRMMLTPGHRVALTAPAYGLSNFVTRVLGFSIPLDIPFDNPTYTFGEKTAYSRLGAIEDRLNGLERPKRAKGGGEAIGSFADYDRDLYISLSRSVIQIECIIEESEDEEGQVVRTLTPAEGVLPIDVEAYLIAEGVRTKGEDWTVRAVGCTAEIVQSKFALQRVIRPVTIRITSVESEDAYVEVCATHSGITVYDEIRITAGSASDGHLHTLSISHSIVRYSVIEEEFVCSPIDLFVSTKYSDGTGLKASQDGYLLYRTDKDPVWRTMAREAGVADINTSEYLSEHTGVRRIDFRYCCPTTEDVVGEGCVTFIENPIIEEDCGQWRTNGRYRNGLVPNLLTGEYRRSHVWYRGCKFVCLTDLTKNPPAWDSPDWQFEEGNPDLTLEWTSPEDSVYIEDPQLTLEVNASLYNQDLTAEPRVKWDWTRESYRNGVRDTASDDIWNAAHENTGTNSQTLVKEDMNYQFNTRPDSLVYRVTATLLDEAGLPQTAPDGTPVSQSMEFLI